MGARSSQCLPRVSSFGGQLSGEAIGRSERNELGQRRAACSPRPSRAAYKARKSSSFATKDTSMKAWPESRQCSMKRPLRPKGCKYSHSMGFVTKGEHPSPRPSRQRARSPVQVLRSAAGARAGRGPCGSKVRQPARARGCGLPTSIRPAPTLERLDHGLHRVLWVGRAVWATWTRGARGASPATHTRLPSCSARDARGARARFLCLFGDVGSFCWPHPVEFVYFDNGDSECCAAALVRVHGVAVEAAGAGHVRRWGGCASQLQLH